MMRDRYSSVWVALLGVAVGVLATLLVVRLGENRRTLRTEYTDWRKLNLILRSLDENYVDTVDRSRVTDAAVSAALGALDPHSVYMPPVELKESEDELQGNFEGIGIQFNVPNDTAVVLEVIPGGPSEKIGLQPGDRLLKVDEVPIAGVKYPQDSMVRRMKGPAGTKVTVTVRRGRDVIPFEITRGRIPMHCVDAAFMVDDTTAYLRLGKFARTTVAEVSSRLQALPDMKRLILDLRDNTGGYFDQALLLSDLFLPKNAPVVYLEGLHRPRKKYQASGKGFLQDVTLAVLVNEGSASSSEIVAGAIQDNDRGLIIGRRSFGKGLVQEPLYFTDGSGVRITVARYYTPSGRCIQKPYGSEDEYAYDLYHRYTDGEMLSADSIKVDTSAVYHTLGDRTVYGGGGIVPDVFVPIDTTRASKFYQACARKATAMRFASAWFDSHKAELQGISSYDSLLRYLDAAGLERAFLSFAASKDGLRPASAAEWKEEKPYMMAQVRALVGRYSQLGDDAFYHLYLSIDNVFAAAMGK
ncbi:MAG: S41 family peptidase [Bacteroidales bacterium]|nr:S41 family peptidase [Bacteroidales bacterium]